MTKNEETETRTEMRPDAATPCACTFDPVPVLLRPFPPYPLSAVDLLTARCQEAAATVFLIRMARKEGDDTPGYVVRSARNDGGRLQKFYGELFGWRFDVTAERLRRGENRRHARNYGRDRRDLPRHAIVGHVLHRDARRDRVAGKGAGPRRTRS